MPRHAKQNRRDWSEQYDELVDTIAQSSPGPQRDALVRRAQQLAAAIQMNHYLQSSDLQSPR